MQKLTRSVARPQHPALAGFHLTTHAQQRMRTRGISEAALCAVLLYGRAAYVRGAMVYAIGRKEIERHWEIGLDLSSFDGVQVVCSPEGNILTAYRSRRLKGGRPGRSSRRTIERKAA